MKAGPTMLGRVSFKLSTVGKYTPFPSIQMAIYTVQHLPEVQNDPNVHNPLLSLPTEVRLKIYGYLFCKQPGMLWLVSHYQVFQPLYAVPASQSDSIFETQFFRCSKKACRDSIAFAYRYNRFEIRGDLTAFCSLGELALRSLRTLSVAQGPWRPGLQEDKTWALIQQHCSGLEYLELILPQDTFLASVPYLEEFRARQAGNEPRPSLALDVYIWDRHFSFDPLYRDLIWSQDIIKRSVEDARTDSVARSRVLGLPRQAKEIVLTADITAGAVQALDAYFASIHGQVWAKSAKSPPHHGHRVIEGRSTRFWYGRT